AAGRRVAASEAAVRLVLRHLYSPEGAILVVDAHRPPFVSQYGDVKRFLAEGLKFPPAAAAGALSVAPEDVEAIAVTGSEVRRWARRPSPGTCRKRCTSPSPRSCRASAS